MIILLFCRPEVQGPASLAGPREEVQLQVTRGHTVGQQDAEAAVTTQVGEYGCELPIIEVTK